MMTRLPGGWGAGLALMIAAPAVASALTIYDDPPPQWDRQSSPGVLVTINGAPGIALPGQTLNLTLGFQRGGAVAEKRLVFLADVINVANGARTRIRQFVLDNSNHGYTAAEGSLEFDYTIPDDLTGALYIDGTASPWSLNRALLEQIYSYPMDGTYTYYWSSSKPGDYGVTQNVIYLGTTICPVLAGNTTYCSGLAFEAFVISNNKYNTLYGHANIGGMTVTQMQAFRRIWYGVTDAEKLAARAIPEYGLGEEITDFEEFQEGDSFQLWRASGSGHNPVFLSWERNTQNEIIGIRYWGTQGSTNGIGIRSEFFTGQGGTVNPNRVYAARRRKPRDQADYDWALGTTSTRSTPTLVVNPSPNGWVVR